MPLSLPIQGWRSLTLGEITERIEVLAIDQVAERKRIDPFNRRTVDMLLVNMHEVMEAHGQP